MRALDKQGSKNVSFASYQGCTSKLRSVVDSRMDAEGGSPLRHPVIGWLYAVSRNSVNI